jgi:uncharacterized membrane protein YtjA (UPF0391 family)
MNSGENKTKQIAARPSDRFNENPGVTSMLYWAGIFFIIAIIAAIFGFGGIAASAAGIAKILFFIFIVLFVLSVIFGSTRRMRRSGL